MGSLWIVEQGLKPGERIVVEGLERVKTGDKVKPTVVDAEATAPAPAPPPGGSPAGRATK